MDRRLMLASDLVQSKMKAFCHLSTMRHDLLQCDRLFVATQTGDASFRQVQLVKFPMVPKLSGFTLTLDFMIQLTATILELVTQLSFVVILCM
jgi:hypothetical protein